MGIAMDNNIHTATVPSDESLGGVSPPSNMFKLSVPDLMLKKECIESKLSNFSGVLKSVSMAFLSFFLSFFFGLLLLALRSSC